MRRLIAALVVTLAIAVTASVFAIWPVVTDAPWEDTVPAPVVAPPREPSRCEVLTQQLADAQTTGAAVTISRLGRELNCW